MSLESNFEDQTLNVCCKGCHKSFPVQYRKILPNGAIVQCPLCQARTELTVSGDALKKLREIDDVLKGFNR